MTPWRDGDAPRDEADDATGDEAPAAWSREEARALEVWKQALDLQKHFNDLHFRLRAFYFGFLGTLAAVRSGLLGTHAASAGALTLPEAPFARVVVSALLVAPGVAVWVLDRFYYHPLLSAAVDRAAELERRVPTLHLVSYIRAQNHEAKVLWVRQGRAKLTLFYGTLNAALLGLLHSDRPWWAVVSVAASGALFFVIEYATPLSKAEQARARGSRADGE